MGHECQCRVVLAKKRKKIESGPHNLCFNPMRAVSTFGAKKILMSWDFNVKINLEQEREGGGEEKQW